MLNNKKKLICIFFSFFIFLSLITSINSFSLYFFNFEKLEYNNSTSSNLFLDLDSTNNDDYYRQYYNVGNFSNFVNETTYNINYINQNYSLNEYSSYLVNQIYFDLDNTVLRNYSLDMNYSLLDNQLLVYNYSYNIGILNNSIFIDGYNITALSNYSLDIYDSIEFNTHIRLYNEKIYSKVNVYCNNLSLYQYNYTDVSIENMSYSLSKINSLAIQNSYNYSEILGIRSIFYNGNYNFSTFIDLPLFFYEIDFGVSYDFRVKIPFYIYLIAIIVLFFILLYLYRIIQDKLKFYKILLVFVVIDVFLFLLLFDVMSIYILGSSEGKFLFTILNALIFGVYLNIIGFSSSNLFSKFSLKISFLTLLIFISLSGFGYLGFLVQFNFPLSLGLVHNKWSTATIDGVLFFLFNGYIFIIIYFLSFITESEI